VTPSDIGMTRILVRLESVCLGETVLNRVTNLEEQHERKSIYTDHLEKQTVLVTVTVDVVDTVDATDTDGSTLLGSFPSSRC
jgi:hypothetical protein